MAALTARGMKQLESHSLGGEIRGMPRLERCDTFDGWAWRLGEARFTTDGRPLTTDGQAPGCKASGKDSLPGMGRSGYDGSQQAHAFGQHTPGLVHPLSVLAIRYPLRIWLRPIPVPIRCESGLLSVENLVPQQPGRPQPESHGPCDYGCLVPLAFDGYAAVQTAAQTFMVKMRCRGWRRVDPVSG